MLRICCNCCMCCMSGMAHRGRLNVLVNLFGKPLGALVNEFTESDVSVADVKYHLGTYAKRQFADKQVLPLTLYH